MGIRRCFLVFVIIWVYICCHARTTCMPRWIHPSVSRVRFRMVFDPNNNSGIWWSSHRSYPPNIDIWPVLQFWYLWVGSFDTVVDVEYWYLAFTYVSVQQWLIRKTRLSLRNNLLKFKSFKEMTDRFRRLRGICLNLMKENQKITTCDWWALETPLGSQPIVHAQESPWTLDVGHVDDLESIYIVWDLPWCTEIGLELLPKVSMF